MRSTTRRKTRPPTPAPAPAVDLKQLRLDVSLEPVILNLLRCAPGSWRMMRHDTAPVLVLAVHGAERFDLDAFATHLAASLTPPT